MEGEQEGSKKGSITETSTANRENGTLEATIPENAALALATLPKSESSHLGIRVVSPDGSEMFFKVKPSTPFSKVFQAYETRQCVTSGSMRFLFDGLRVRDDQTPSDLNMEEGDTVDAVLQQVGGRCIVLFLTPHGH